jgi:Delta7-sterol 5-desaturase
MVRFRSYELTVRGDLIRMIMNSNVSTSFIYFAVAFPGAKWLDRIASDSSSSPAAPFVYQQKLYSSVYAAFLDNRPLDYPCRNLNAWINSIFLSPSLAGIITERLLQLGCSLDMAHYVLCYLRNFIGALVVYYGTAAAFHYVIYIQHGSTFFQDRPMPSAAIMWHQIKLAQASMILYVLLPVVDEFLVESGYTPLVYYTLSDIGGLHWYLLYTALYFLVVEIGIYWMHRTLHTNKVLYKYLHLKHHIYNAPDTLTPWASIAFHPLDGILQASPYVFALWLVPCHYPTHFALLFFTAIWATYIHDSMEYNPLLWGVPVIMGSRYHTMHHTHYSCNYGQVLTLCDWFWGTLREPDTQKWKTMSAAQKVLGKTKAA